MKPVNKHTTRTRRWERPILMYVCFPLLHTLCRGHDYPVFNETGTGQTLPTGFTSLFTESVFSKRDRVAIDLDQKDNSTQLAVCSFGVPFYPPSIYKTVRGGNTAAHVS